MSNLQRGFVLHRRPYSESSLLVDLFTEQTGRLTVLAKGARGKRSKWKSILQPFTPLLLAWVGKTELKTLTQAEAMVITLPLEQQALYSGFYLNELLSRVIEIETPYPDLFQDYLQCLIQLAREDSIEPSLRYFEFKLLKTLGYGVDFCHCAGSGLPVDEKMNYQYRPEKGFIASMVKNNQSFYGRELLAFHYLNFDDPEILQAAKRFTRIALKPFLGGKPLKSRELFIENLL